MSAIAAVFVALYAGHQIGDFWAQTQRQANRKGLPGWAGRAACASHVCTYTAAQLVALVALFLVAGWWPNLWQMVAGLAVSAGTHYIADRRAPLRWLADRLRKNAAWLEQGGGLLHLDQSWHIGWLFVAALIIGG
ncbi:transcriptional regulator [Micromonospora craterilacus]|uniref:Transcriptional regulator n=1 Tax=Micromonospora craterilacus TaxID=1655439 RepID=A0A2W2EVL3_9ACTN|nr:DUF3307 domain-containing protein [Micromonospora craterilacus]PZG16498.1 transcriptional regulator [Micromonospora craterilacus]